MEIDEAIGTTLREWRKRKAWTQETLALEAGVERNYISLIELGRNSPSVRMLFKICGALGVSPAVLIAEAERRIKSKSR